jgi:hypothetical protein
VSALALERYAREAIDREERCDFRPVESARILHDLVTMKDLNLLKWRERQRRILADPGFRVRQARRASEMFNPNVARLAGIRCMPEGSYGALLAYPPAGTVTTTSLSGTVILYPNLTYSPLPANSFLTPQAYRVAVVGKHTTGTTPGNLGWNPLINSTGAWTTGGAAVSGGSTLGASSTVTGTASITNAFFYIVGDLTIRSIGAPGANASIVALIHGNTTHPTAGPTTIPATGNLLFGGTAVSFDFTAAQSFQLGGVHTTTTWTHNIEQLHFMDWN